MSPITEPTAPDPNRQRLSRTPLPPYRYLPGINAHPTRDPSGHSYGRHEDKLLYLEPSLWRQNEPYLFGVDLYNYAFWWESHEAWESVWHTTDKDSPYGQYLQGLIQIAAAFIKWRLHEYAGVKKLFEIGFRRLQSVAEQHDSFMGCDVTAHLAKIRSHFTDVLSRELTKDDAWPDEMRNYPFLELA